MTTTLVRCANVVHWFDIDMATRCIRRDGHDGHHRDRLRWWDDDGLQYPRYVEPVTPESDGERLTDEQVLHIRRRYASGSRLVDIARSMGLGYYTVFGCAHGRTYRTVVEPVTP